MTTGLDVRVEHVPRDNAATETLRAEQQAELRARYADEDASRPMTGDGVLATVLLRDGDGPAACGVLRDASDEHGPGTGELKRMYVRVGHRGRGLSRRVLTALEAAAVAHGLHRLVLETGPLQPEAIGLYLTSGYLPVENYGEYVGALDSRCFAKDLDTAPVAQGTGARGPRPEVVVDEVPWHHPDATALRRAMYADLIPLYPELVVDDDAFAALDAAQGDTAVATFVVRHDGVPVACATHRRAPEWGDDAAELKRLYVAPSARGLGLARLLVRRVEESARAHGARRVVLDTGIRQPAAITLYLALGYRPAMPPDGAWQALPLSLWFARDL